MDITPAQREILAHAVKGTWMHDGKPIYPVTATHWFTRHMGNPMAITSQAYRALKKLERMGLMQGVRAPSGGDVRWWKITDAGVAILGSLD